ncbi:exodeoxyribonuclease VII large subunit [Candidatus Providencia siddallii]|uniref:Exodeoxyribonuclease 7 large subunit n=1 Tax=Candidatus Providencia siddallii TaxID=1715285 RepID=A0ABP1CF58_9GAMM
MSIKQNNIIYSVSNINKNARKLLENQIGQIWLTAEVSNFSQPSSGHWYLTLKDDRSQIRAAMFRNQNLKLQFRPQNGSQILVKAILTIYEPRGDYQLIIEYMKPSGEGLLQQKFEQLKQTLMLEGLFEIIHKKHLPTPTNSIGIITSPTGAAIQDILKILQRRDPSLPIIIYPTQVQGDNAANQISHMIEIANLRKECDVIIIGRGGGTLEDLWAFNEEIVARAIFNSKIPIISAVGHETDVTISDYVADIRAPTPSAAAELVSRDQSEMIRQLKSSKQHIEIAMDYYLSNKQRIFAFFYHRLKQQHPELNLIKQKNKLNLLKQKLIQIIIKLLQLIILNFKKNEYNLLQNNLQTKIQKHQQNLISTKYHIQNLIITFLNDYNKRFISIYSKLETVSPLLTISRGFSISQTLDGTILKKIKQVKLGMTLLTRLSDGWVESKIFRIKNKI